ncbi:MAG: protein translocase subunit SecF, partial [Pseudomonadota bacterium]
EQEGDDAAIQQEVIATVKGALSETFPGIQYLQTDSVGAKVSGELVQAGILAIVLAISAVLFYIWLRFEWQFSVGAVAALVHDVILTIGVFAITQIEFNLSIIAAILTIVGYSLNDTVVVFDRVRENLRRFKQTELAEVLNLSINETLSRTLMTSATTLLALIALYVLGGDVIRGFTFAMIWGVLVGTYSSVFIASPILLRLDVKRDWSKPDGGGAGTQFANIDA